MERARPEKTTSKPIMEFELSRQQRIIPDGNRPKSDSDCDFQGAGAFTIPNAAKWVRGIPACESLQWSETYQTPAT